MQAVSERWVLRFPDFKYASFFRVHSALCICRAACFSATLLINLSLFITFMNAFSDGAEIIMRNDVENELAPIDLCEFAFTCNG